MVLKSSKFFSQFWGDVSKKLKFVIAIFLYGSDCYHYTLSENFIAGYVITYCFGYISI